MKNLENDLLEMKLQFFASDEEFDEEVSDQNDESGETEDDGSKDDKGTDDKKDSNESKMFTQAEVNRMMTREKKQGRSSVYNELGIDPRDGKTINMFKAFIASQKSEEAEENSDAVNQRIAELEEKAFVAEAKVEAIRLGIKAQYVEDAITLAMAKKGNNDELKDVITEFKTKYPIWFEESEEDDSRKTGQKGTGSSINVNDKDKKGGKNGKSLGARLAAQRKGSSKKTSYWSY